MREERERIDRERREREGREKGERERGKSTTNTKREQLTTMTLEGINDRRRGNAVNMLCHDCSWGIERR